MRREVCGKGGGKNLKGSSFVLVFQCTRYPIKVRKGARETAQQLRTLVSLEEIQVQFPTPTQWLTTIHNSTFKGIDVFF